MSRVVLVTGACGEIGSALCQRFLDLGDTVLALDADANSLDSLVSKWGAKQIKPILANLKQPVQAAVERVTEQCGPVDVLVANAGVAMGASLAATNAAGWQCDIKVDLTRAYYAVEAVRASMIERQFGSLVLIDSITGRMAPSHPASTAAKASLVSYTKLLATELGRYGIRANIVCPDAVKTPAWRAPAERDPQMFEDLQTQYPLRDFATPNDIADVVWFLASPMARVITGVALPIGGELIVGNRSIAEELTTEVL